MTVCLPGANIEDVTGTVGLVTGNGHGRYIRVHVGTNNTEMEGRRQHRKLVSTLKEIRVKQTLLFDNGQQRKFL